MLDKISKKYKINYETLIKDCGLGCDYGENNLDCDELEYIHINSKRYLYNHKSNQVYTCNQKFMGFLCKETFQIIPCKKT